MKIAINNLAKTYENIKAVDNLSITIEQGEFVTILGPSGCGKSTLLFAISGILEPTKGEIYFNDTKINDVSIEDRNIGMVFQNYSLYPHMTIAENLMFPLKMKGIKKKQALEKAKEISKLIHVEELLNRKPKELSGGQQQRVAIGRAIIKDPEVLLMDEPFSNLDEALRLEMREEIKSLQKKTGITTLFVTHDQEEALSISDKILLMNQGKCIQYSTPKELYDNPNSIFSASFIGNPKINLLEKDDYITNIIKEDKNLNEGIIAIRPEDIEVRKIEENINKNNLQGIIEDVQPMGKDIYLKVRVEESLLRVITTKHASFLYKDRVVLNFKKIHNLKE